MTKHIIAQFYIFMLLSSLSMNIYVLICLLKEPMGQASFVGEKRSHPNSNQSDLWFQKIELCDVFQLQPSLIILLSWMKRLI